MQCNISQTDRTNRIVIGVLLIVAALFGVGKIVMIILGLIILVEGIIGWCGIPILAAKIKYYFIKRKN